MRVIGGKYRGKKLCTLEGELTRPTLDRVKENMFNMAMPWLCDSVVLDLFGGSGGLAIEAISRGANKAYINDKSSDAKRIIQQNIKSVGCDDAVEISSLDWQAFIEKALQNDMKFDIIILDPPYSMDCIYDCVARCKGLLNDDGIIILEHDDSVAFGSDVIKEKKYGKVWVTFIGADNE